MFGFNPMNSNFYNGYKLMAVPVGKAGKYNRTGELLADGQLEIVYGPADEMYLGRQDGVIDRGPNSKTAKGVITYTLDRGSRPGYVLVDGREYKLSKGVKPIKSSPGKYEFKLKDSSVLKIPDGVDYSYSSYHSRNSFAITNKYLSERTNARIMSFLRQNGDAMNATQLSELPLKEQKNWVEFTTDPITGETMYIRSSAKDALSGTEGVKVSGRILAPVVKAMRGIIQGAKQGIIIGRPASYINSYVSNVVTLMVHRDRLNPLAVERELRKARSEIKGLKARTDVAMRLIANPKTKQRGYDALAKLQKHELWYALNDGGLQTSIRGNLQEVGLMPRNELITVLKNNGFANVSEDTAKAIETIMLQPNTDLGTRLGEMFDMTEIAPKVVLYKELLKDGLSKEKAAAYVKFAYPDYNMNLPQVMALADEFMPFMKYFMNVPRMTSFAMEQKPFRLLGLWIAGASAIEASNQLWDPYNEYYVNNDYFQLAPGVYKYTDSLTNYDWSMPGAADVSFLAAGLWFNNLNPVTIEYSELPWNRN
jgi:hypothetical protein